MNKKNELMQILENHDIDGFFVSKENNVNYLSGFTDEASFIFITPEENFFITDGRFEELAQKLCLGFTIINWQKTNKSLIQVIYDLAKEKHINKIGFESQWLSYENYEKMKRTVKDIPLIPTSNIIESLRYVKTPEEISKLRKASDITDYSFEEIIKYIRPGMTEKQVAARLEYIIKMAGGDGVGFDTILISGEKTSLPHGKPSDKKIQKGDFVTMDYGALVDGYTSDMTRTIIIGQASEKQIQIYNLVKEAQEKALETIRDGINSDLPDTKARQIVEKYIDYYYPGIGHGIGLDLHEAPFLSSRGDYKIKENCVITVEPGLYIPNWGGVRIEDSVLVKKDGFERLTKSSKDLIIID